MPRFLEVLWYAFDESQRLLGRSVRSFFAVFALIFALATAAMAAVMPLENIQMDGISIVKDSLGTTISGRVFAADGKAMPAMVLLVKLEDRKGKELDTVIMKIPAISAGESSWASGTTSRWHDSASGATLIGFATMAK